jgi:hypothetical protein
LRRGDVDHADAAASATPGSTPATFSRHGAAVGDDGDLLPDAGAGRRERRARERNRARSSSWPAPGADPPAAA